MLNKQNYDQAKSVRAGNISELILVPFMSACIYLVHTVEWNKGKPSNNYVCKATWTQSSVQKRIQQKILKETSMLPHWLCGKRLFGVTLWYDGHTTYTVVESFLNLLEFSKIVVRKYPV